MCSACKHATAPRWCVTQDKAVDCSAVFTQMCDPVHTLCHTWDQDLCSQPDPVPVPLLRAPPMRGGGRPGSTHKGQWVASDPMVSSQCHAAIYAKAMQRLHCLNSQTCWPAPKPSTIRCPTQHKAVSSNPLPSWSQKLPLLNFYTSNEAARRVGCIVASAVVIRHNKKGPCPPAWSCSSNSSSSSDC